MIVGWGLGSHELHPRVCNMPPQTFLGGRQKVPKGVVGHVSESILASRVFLGTHESPPPSTCVLATGNVELLGHGKPQLMWTRSTPTPHLIFPILGVESSKRGVRGGQSCNAH